MADLPARYRIRKALGTGAFGRVLLAEDQELERPVAIKILHRGFPEAHRHRFEREAQLASRARSPHLVEVLDFQVEGDAPFLVYEFIPGRDLRDVLKTSEAPISTRVRWLREILQGLLALHQIGIVHRDLKPENVLIHEDGRALVADLGLALSDTAERLTKTGMVVGTLAFMAPEILDGGPASPESDLYALGCLGIEVLYQNPLWSTDSVPILLNPKREIEPEIERRLGRFPGLDPWLWRCLRRRPQDRFAGALEALHALEDIQDLSSRGERGPVTFGTSPAVDASSQPQAPRARRVLVPILLVSLGLGLGFLLEGDSRIPEPASPPESSRQAPAPSPTPRPQGKVLEECLAWLPVGGRDELGRRNEKTQTLMDPRIPKKIERVLRALVERLPRRLGPTSLDDFRSLIFRLHWLTSNWTELHLEVLALGVDPSALSRSQEEIRQVLLDFEGRWLPTRLEAGFDAMDLLAPALFQSNAPQDPEGMLRRLWSSLRSPEHLPLRPAALRALEWYWIHGFGRNVDLAVTRGEISGFYSRNLEVLDTLHPTDRLGDLVDTARASQIFVVRSFRKREFQEESLRKYRAWLLASIEKLPPPKTDLLSSTLMGDFRRRRGMDVATRLDDAAPGPRALERGLEALYSELRRRGF